MTPSANIPTTSANSPSPSLHSNLLSASGLGSSQVENATQEMSPADSAITSIGALIQSFSSITDFYPGVGEAEKQGVVVAITKYMEKVIGSLNSSPSAQQPTNGGLPSY